MDPQNLPRCLILRAPPECRVDLPQSAHGVCAFFKIKNHVSDYMHIFERRFQAESQNLAALPVSLKFCVRQRLNDSVTVSAGHKCYGRI